MTIRITTLNKNLRNIRHHLISKSYSVKNLNKVLNQIYHNIHNSKYPALFGLGTLKTPIRTAEMFLAYKNSLEYDDMLRLPNNSAEKQQFFYIRNFVKNYPHKWFLCIGHTRISKTKLPNGDTNISITKYPISNLNKLSVLNFVKRLQELIKLIRKGYPASVVICYACTW